MPQTLTLKTVRETFWTKVSNKTLNFDAAEKLMVDGVINQVQSRFISQGKWRGSIVRARFAVYNQTITLPDSLESVLKYSPVDEDGGICYEASVWNQWHSLIGNDTDGEFAPYRATDLGEGWATFRDSPYETFYIKSISDQTESGKGISLRGADDNGKIIYTTGGTEGVTLTVAATANTTMQVFSSLDYWVKSAATAGVVRLYAVNADDTSEETLVAIIVPGKLVSNYRRYAIPMCSGDNPVVEVLAKRAYTPAVADNDPIIPSNIGALKLGLMSLQYEDKSDWERAEHTMQRAIDLLESERQEVDGDALPTLQFASGFGASSIPYVL